MRIIKSGEVDTGKNKPGKNLMSLINSETKLIRYNQELAKGDEVTTQYGANKRLPQPETERRIPVKFKPPDVSIDDINRIREWYHFGNPLTRILRKINGISMAGTVGGPNRNLTSNALSLVDVYSILFIERKEGRVTQRKDYLSEELTIEQFAHVFQLWKRGLNSDEIEQQLEIEDVRQHYSERGLRRAMRAIAARWSTVKARQKEEAATQAEEAQEILSELEVQTIRQGILMEAGTVLRSKAFVVYVTEMDRSLRESKEFQQMLDQREQQLEEARSQEIEVIAAEDEDFRRK